MQAAQCTMRCPVVFVYNRDTYARIAHAHRKCDEDICPAVIIRWVHTTHIVIFVFTFSITTLKMYFLKVLYKGMCHRV